MSDERGGSAVSDVLLEMPWVRRQEDVSDDAGDPASEWGLIGPPNQEAQQVATDKHFGRDRVEVEPPPVLPAAFGAYITKDSGERQEFETGSQRDTRDGKGRYDLLPPHAIQRLAQLFERGVVKYGDRNWEKGQPLSRYLDSALRHTFQVLDGNTDEDHAIAAAWNLLCFVETQARIKRGELPAELDDL